MSAYGDLSLVIGEKEINPAPEPGLDVLDVATATFDQLLDARLFEPHFQPVVDLRTGHVVGLEALARGPIESVYSSSRELFGAAAERGRVAELDWVCRVAAFRAVMGADVPPSVSVFVNIEPESLSTPCPPDLKPLLARAESQLRVFVEINDRALTMEPASLLAAVDRARELGWGVAVDDVGASRGCLAILPVIDPDVVKLDFGLMRTASSSHNAAVVTDVMRYVERTKASLIAEGLETEAEAAFARALGAGYGQGHFLGLPGPLEDRYQVPRAAVPVIGHPIKDAPVRTVHDLLEGAGNTTRVGPRELRRLFRLAVHSCAAAPGRPMVLVNLGPADGILAEDIKLLTEPDIEAVLLVMFGAGVSASPAPGLRGVRLRPHDPLAQERFIVTLTEDRPSAMVARPVPGSSAVFDLVSTYDEAAVQRVARHLVRRMPPRGVKNTALPLPSEPHADIVADTPATSRERRETRFRRLLR